MRRRLCTKKEHMELALNLAWIMLTALMCGLWIRYGPVKGASRQTQFIALALVLAILFPVISVTDDIVMAQNPAETDCCQRKGHAVEHAHATPHSIAATIPPVVAAVSADPSPLTQPGHPPVPALGTGIGLIQNRPPPAA